MKQFNILYFPPAFLTSANKKLQFLCSRLWDFLNYQLQLGLWRRKKVNSLCSMWKRVKKRRLGIFCAATFNHDTLLAGSCSMLTIFSDRISSTLCCTWKDLLKIIVIKRRSYFFLSIYQTMSKSSFFLIFNRLNSSLNIIWLFRNLLKDVTWVWNLTQVSIYELIVNSWYFYKYNTIFYETKEKVKRFW